MPKADSEAEEILRFLPLREGELQRILVSAISLPVHTIPGGDAASLVLVGFATFGLGGGLGRLGCGGRVGV